MVVKPNRYSVISYLKKLLDLLMMPISSHEFSFFVNRKCATLTDEKSALNVQVESLREIGQQQKVYSRNVNSNFADVYSIIVR